MLLKAESSSLRTEKRSEIMSCNEDNIEALFAELSLVNILENYLSESDWENEEEEDIVLAALAVLAEDDRQARGLDDKDQQQTGTSLMGNLVLGGTMAALAAASEVAQAAAESSIEVASGMARGIGEAVSPSATTSSDYYKRNG